MNAPARAERLGISRNNIYAAIQNEQARTISVNQLEKIAEAMAPGYRSHCVPEGVFSSLDDVRIYVQEWLETAPCDPSWQRYVEDRQQLNLF